MHFMARHARSLFRRVASLALRLALLAAVATGLGRAAGAAESKPTIESRVTKLRSEAAAKAAVPPESPDAFGG